MMNDVSHFKQLQNSVDRLQTRVELLEHENKRLKAENKQLRTRLSTVYDQVNREWAVLEESVSRSMLSIQIGLRNLRNAVVIDEDD